MTTSVRLAPDPPSASAPAVLGTSAVAFDEAVTVRLDAAVSASPMVNAIGADEVSSAIVTLATAEIAGAVPPPIVCRQLAMVLAALLIERALSCCTAVPVGAPP